MKAPPSLLAASSLLTMLSASVAQAEDIALNFELPPTESPEVVEPAPDAVALVATPFIGPKPLPIPPGAGNPPMRSHSSQQLPSGVYRQAVAAGLSAGNSAATLLPPAPPLNRPAPAIAAQPEQTEAPAKEEAKSEPPSDPIALSFEVAPSETVQMAQRAKSAPAPKLPANPLDSLFEGGTDSLVARAVGSAEGTRTPSGGITSAYYGHSDPGNGVWNMGTFSYQHGAKTAAEADQKQLNRLKSQSQVLKQRAVNHGLNLNLEETLNGIDLANQSPLASIGRVGYIERLVEARNMGYSGSEAIVVARTRSYINPNTQRWNAPGLGNTLESITRDQQRRANAVAQAMAVYQQENDHIDWQHWALMPSAESMVAAAPEPAATAASQEPVDIAFSLWTDGYENTDEATITQAEPAAHQASKSEDADRAAETSVDTTVDAAVEANDSLLPGFRKVPLKVPESLTELTRSLGAESVFDRLRSDASIFPSEAESSLEPEISSIDQQAQPEALSTDQQPENSVERAPDSVNESSPAASQTAASLPPKAADLQPDQAEPRNMTETIGASVNNTATNDPAALREEPSEVAPTSKPNGVSHEGANAADAVAVATAEPQLVEFALKADAEAVAPSKTPTAGAHELPDAQANALASPDKAVPTWAETRERNQTAAFEPPPKTPADEANQLNQPVAMGSAINLNDAEAAGAVPETTVMPPLQEDWLPVAVPGFTKPQGGLPSAIAAAEREQTSIPLPEGVQAQLQNQSATKEATNYANPDSERERVTETLFGIDTYVLPGSE